MFHKNRKYRRRQRELHIRHKENIIRSHQFTEDTWMPVRGKLSKGKVHCSCGMCRFYSYTHQDAKKAASMLDALQEEDLTVVATHTAERLRKIRHKTARVNGGSSHSQSTAEKFDYTDVLLEKEYRKLTQRIHNLYVMNNTVSVYREIDRLKEQQKALDTYIATRRG